MPDDTEADDAFDPVALTLALWLGLIAGLAGIGRLSEQAAIQADLARARAGSGTMVTALPSAARAPLGG